MTQATVRRSHTPLVFILLALIFFGPFVIAWKVYSSHAAFLPRKTINTGNLIQPPIDFTQFDTRFDHRWLMVYVISSSCNASCQHDLHMMRQVSIALGKDMDRVQTQLITLQTKPELIKILPKVPALYLVDPHNNMMMFYPAQFSPKGLLNDLTRLLNTSQIG